MVTAPTQMSPTRNESMDCCKLLASFFVVFIHVSFPGDLGEVIIWLGGFAVPMFFAISGYFNYQADSDRILKRTKHILKLYAVAVGCSLLWGVFATEYDGGSSAALLIRMIPDPDEFTRWITLQLDPFSGHLWYLNAAVVTYLLYWVYVRFWGGKTVDYKPLYCIGFCLLAVFFAFSVFMPIKNPDLATLDSRNAWFTGLPMFTLGLFLREYQERIFSNFRLTTGMLITGIIIGALLIVQQWSAVRAGTPFGTIIVTVALMLLLISHPKIPVKSKFARVLIAKCGIWSTWIYILHLVVYNFYLKFCREGLVSALGEREAWLQPLFVAGMSLLAAVLCERLQYLAKRIRKKTK